ncbi:MAG: hypothetical protein CMJ85_00035 [Planctomycetes bacterium]|nr:hypothetical protein [Planctomycetota bacterium]MDP6423441.1 hypothetical protein [Planctomycetota bacterium]
MTVKKKMSGLEFAMAELKKNKKAAYADIKGKADKKGIKKLPPVVFGRAKALLGLVPVAARGKGKAARAKKRVASKARAKGAAKAGASKSDQIRKMLRAGLKASEIAKKVGSSPAYVYVVKSKSQAKRGPGRPKKRGPGRPRKIASASGLDALLSGIKVIERERDAYRRTLENLRDGINKILS